MKVILIDNVLELGRRGEVVKVTAGYGRNYLIPRQLAVPATPANIKRVEEQRLSLAKKEAQFVEEAELLAQELSQIHVLVSRKAGDTGVLFGSVTSKDLSEALAAGGINMDRRKIVLKQPIKTLGNFSVEVRPHSDVEAKILLSVLPEGDEGVARVLPRGEESDRIIHDLDTKLGSATIVPEREVEPVVPEAPEPSKVEEASEPKTQEASE